MSIYTKYLTVCFIILSSWLNAQDYTITAVPTEESTELEGNRVGAIHQDGENYIWLVTQSGLVRYDGHHYQWFNKTNSKLRDIPRINQIVEDDNGYIWLNQNTKIDLIHHETFEVLYFEELFPEFKENSFAIKKLARGGNGSIFIKVKDNKQETIYIYKPDTGLQKFDVPGKRNDFVHADQNTIWLYRNRRLFQHDINTAKLLSSTPDLGFSNIQVVKGADNRSLFSGLRDQSVVLFEVKDGKVDELLNLKTQKSLGGRDKFFYDAENKIFLLPFREPMTYVEENDTEEKNFSIFPTSEVQPFLKLYTKDKDGIIWSYREERGLRLLKINPTKFQYSNKNKRTRSLWVNDEFLFANNHQIALDDPEKSITLNVRSVSSSEHSIRDKFWAGYIEGIRNFYSDDGNLEPPIYLSAKLRSRKKAPWSILQDKEGRWWAGFFGNVGLATTFKQQKDSLYSYEQYNQFDELQTANIIHLLEDGEHIWAASTVGLHLINKEKGVVRRYASNVEAPYSLDLDNAYFIYKDQQNYYWVATNADGLIRFRVDEDWQITDYKKYTTQDGLSSNILYTIVEDDNERLWISTFNGLSCLDKKTENIQVFYELDGLPFAEFNRTSYFKADDGRIYFGSPKGVVSFFPDDVIKTGTYDAKVTITKFEQYENDGEQLIDKTAQLIEKQQIKLLPSVRFFRLDVSLLDYFNTKKVRYAYRIKGLFNDYRFMDGNTIEIGGLPYGKYQLIIKGQGADRRFSTEELTIPLTVVRPFYLKWWFVLLMLATLMISGIQIYLWRVRLLEERKNELELLVKERTAKIEEQAVQLRELDELKSKFFANISHELRTPLTLILAPLSDLFNIKNLTNRHNTQLMLMQQNGRKLLKRINELLDLSRLDANKLEVHQEPTFLYFFFKRLLSSFESPANMKNVKLLLDYDLDENVQILTDQDKLEKITSNYLSNAMKFTPKDGSITLSIKKEKRFLQISVTDTGIGIPEKDLERVFDRFYQINSSDAEMQRLNPQGSGIGLSLCQELAKVLKGRVWVTSEIGKGSVFYVEIPFIESFAVKEGVTEDTEQESVAIEEIVPLAAAPQPLHKDVQKSTVLVVEDNPDLRNYLTLLLQDHYKVVTAENGEDAAHQLGIEHYELKDKSGVIPNLIISDIMMPVMDGLELLSKLKESDEHRHIPVIMLTARKSMEVKLDALRIGVDDYLTKPFTTEELLARIANLIENSNNRLTTTVKKEAPAISSQDLKWIEEVEKLIIENIDNSDFKLNELAPILNLSYSQINRKIKQITGLSPKKYERTVKLTRARTLLTSGEYTTVSEVMYRLGFENHYYFSKIYKQTFGIMPSEELKNA